MLLLTIDKFSMNMSYIKVVVVNRVALFDIIKQMLNNFRFIYTNWMRKSIPINLLKLFGKNESLNKFQ
jgi:hypothetical protein